MEESVNRDRLSELPDSLIHFILSFLSMRDVVSTTLLSKRWNKLWTTVPYLTFHEPMRDGAIERVRNFVNRALLMWNGTKILKFKISIYDIFDSSLADDVDLWVRFAVNYKVEEMEMLLSYEGDLRIDNAYRFPLCVYSCSSVRKLSIKGFNLGIHGPPCWNQLKSLHIESYHLSELMINRIMLGSPQLEVLGLCHSEDSDNLSIMSTKLKKLLMWRYLPPLMGISTLDTVFRLCCPNLEIFKFYGCLYGKCLFMNVSSLIDATLHLEFYYDEDVDDLRVNELLREPLRQLFSTRVERVALSDTCAYRCVKVVDASPKKYLISPSAKFLELEADIVNEFGEMMNLLEIFPNLETLVIEHLAFTTPPDLNAVEEFEANLSSNSFMSQLKTAEITSKWSDISSNFRFIELLLKHAIGLERLLLRFGEDSKYPQTSKFQMSKKLISMPRSSPTAKVILTNR